MNVGGRLQISKSAIIVHADQDDFPFGVILGDAVDKSKINPGSKGAIKTNDGVVSVFYLDQIGRDSIILFLIVEMVDVDGISGHNYRAETHKLLFQVFFEAGSGDDGKARLDFFKMVENF